MSAPPTSRRPELPLLGGAEGNERLTVQAGATLFVLLAVLGLTIVRIGQLLWLHLFLGLVLIGPLALKLASAGYRFAGYYAGRNAYREKGPPTLAMRVLAPALVLDTLVVFASGVVLLLAGPGSRETWLPVHKFSFIAWLVLAALHVLGHIPELARGLLAPRETRAAVLASVASSGAAGTGGARVAHGPFQEPRAVLGYRPAARLPGARARAIALAAALLAGLVLAALLIPEFAPWLHHGAHG